MDARGYRSTTLYLASDGSPDSVTDVTDIWTFARELGARDPNWKLVATESA